MLICTLIIISLYICTNAIATGSYHFRAQMYNNENFDSGRETADDTDFTHDTDDSTHILTEGIELSQLTVNSKP